MARCRPVNYPISDTLKNRVSATPKVVTEENNDGTHPATRTRANECPARRRRSSQGQKNDFLPFVHCPLASTTMVSSPSLLRGQTAVRPEASACRWVACSRAGHRRNDHSIRSWLCGRKFRYRLDRSDLNKFVGAIRVPPRCGRTIMQNFWTLDSIGVGSAAFGFLDPLLAPFIHVSSEMTLVAPTSLLGQSACRGFLSEPPRATS